MNGETVSLIIMNVMLTATGQILLKAGMASTSVQAGLMRGGLASASLAVGLQPMIWAGLFAYGTSLLLWLAVLARLPISSAYPFVAVSIALTSIAGAALFGDSFTPGKVVGTMLILAGVVALSRG